ncbi:MAG TPA: hypothetical protein VOB72_00990 [Candidatus Dormibacteraeota bacterium]|nr:hypothetical protein [Candidatus Dormibacteraeota bacterium]
MAAALGLVLSTGTAAAQQAVGPNQQFAGVVNGNTADATIIMICPGPATPGQLGHPQAGQTVQVVTDSGTGFTGSAANRIVATLGPSSSTTPTFVFREYGVAQDIPTTAFLPCSGTGTAVFTPQPTSSTARSATVTLHFLNIAV